MAHVSGDVSRVNEKVLSSSIIEVTTLHIIQYISIAADFEYRMILYSI